MLRSLTLRTTENFLLKLHDPGKALRVRAVLDRDVDFCRRGVVSIPKPSFLLRQEPGLTWVLLRLVPEKKAQLRATNFFSLTPGFPGLWVGSEEPLQGIHVYLENGRRFLLRAHAAGE